MRLTLASLLFCTFTLAAQTAPVAPQAETPGPDYVWKTGPSLVSPKILHSVDHEYTEEARKRKIRGSVEVEVVVDADGHPSNTRVVRSLAGSYKNPEDQAAALSLDRRAVEAVNRYLFTPGTVHGQPVRVKIYMDISFQLF